MICRIRLLSRYRSELLDLDGAATVALKPLGTLAGAGACGPKSICTNTSTVQESQVSISLNFWPASRVPSQVRSISEGIRVEGVGNE